MKRRLSPGLAGQLAAALALLAGCGIFSYLAWSEVAPRLLAAGATATSSPPLATAPAGSVMATGASALSNETAVPGGAHGPEQAEDRLHIDGAAARAGGSRQGEVRRLREDNHRLHQRLAALESAMTRD